MRKDGGEGVGVGRGGGGGGGDGNYAYFERKKNKWGQHTHLSNNLSLPLHKDNVIKFTGLSKLQMGSFKTAPGKFLMS